MEFSSKLLEQAVEEISKLPGIGKKTALRLALHLLKQPEDQTLLLTEKLKELRENIKYCQMCHIISDVEDCTCKKMSIDPGLVCVVEETPDVLAIRNTGQYNGMFHVLGGRISPLDGIGPDELMIASLINRINLSEGGIKEVILALSGTLEGDTTAFYLTRQLEELDVDVTSITRGIPVGGELEYADEVTLGRSILTRSKVNTN